MALTDVQNKTPVTKAIIRPHYWFLPGVKKMVVMKVSRAVHAYLSAFAFLALMFFALTGFLLNHPEIIKSTQNEARILEAVMPVGELKVLLAEEAPDQKIAMYVSNHFKVIGAYKSAEIFDEEVMLRFASAKGATTVFIDTASGAVELTVKKANGADLIRELHRGKDTSSAWRLLIDVIAIITLILSLIGFFLFFTIRYRLATSLKLCGASLVVFITLYLFTIP